MAQSQKRGGSNRALLRDQSNKSIMILNQERLNTSEIHSNIPRKWEHVGIKK